MSALTIWDGRFEIPEVAAFPAGTSIRNYNSGVGNFGYTMFGSGVTLSDTRMAFSFSSTDFATYPSGSATLLYDRAEPTSARLAALPYNGNCAFARDRFYVGNLVHDLDGNLLYTASFPAAAQVVGDRAVYFDMPSSTWVAHIYDARTGRELGQWDTTATSGAIDFALAGNRLTIVRESDNKAILIDTDSMTVVATLSVGTFKAPGYIKPPRGVATSGNLVAVANTGSNNVTVIDTAAGSVVRTIAVGVRPMGVSVYRNFAAVANNGANTISVINIATGATLGTHNVDPGVACFVALHGARYVAAVNGVIGRAIAFGYASGVTGELRANLWNGAAEQPVSSITTS